MKRRKPEPGNTRIRGRAGGVKGTRSRVTGSERPEKILTGDATGARTREEKTKGLTFCGRVRNPIPPKHWGRIPGAPQGNTLSSRHIANTGCNQGGPSD